MSKDKSIEKNERKTMEEIENICGVSFRRVNMTNYTKVENIYNFNDDGLIIMIGVDLNELNIDDNKLKLLGESIKNLKNLERFLISCPKGKEVPEWLRELFFIKDLILIDSQLLAIPDFIKDFKNLNSLYLLGNEIALLPDWLISLNKLKILNLNDRTQTLDLTQSNMDILRTLQEKKVKISDPSYKLHIKERVPLDQIEIIKKISWYGDGKNRVFSEELRSIDEPWRDPRTYGVCLRVFNGKILQMSIKDTNLQEIPEDLGNLKDLTFISMIGNKLTSLPESIGNLEHLNEFILSNNNITSLPESFVNLTSLQKLDLSNNHFSEIPTQLWALNELTELKLSNNQLNSEENTIIQKVPDLIREYLRKKATIIIFISHAVIDFEPYRIKELVDYLNKQNEISQVFFCEEDLTGNIDEWMLNAVQKSQLILFVGTNKSVYNSPDCDNELKLAEKFSIPVIPLKGKDIDWPDLAEKNLSRELGIEYDVENFDTFCIDMYKYIFNFKRELDLMSKEDRQTGMIDIYERFRLILDERLAEMLKKIDDIAKRVSNLENKS